MRPAAALIAATLFFSIVTAPFDAHAGGYPERPIKLIVPTTAGSVARNVVPRWTSDSISSRAR